jgi:hypothetical protein
MQLKDEVKEEVRQRQRRLAADELEASARRTRHAVLTGKIQEFESISNLVEGLCTCPAIQSSKRKHDGKNDEDEAGEPPPKRPKQLVAAAAAASAHLVP